MKHADIWRGIDRLAEECGLSVSGLARKAGLDPTTFNKSKRATPTGRLRWPSTESLAKLVESTGTSMSHLVALMDSNADRASYRRIPLIGLAQAGDAGYFDDAGFPIGGGWDEILFPELGDPNAYALEVCGDSMEPAYREGDYLIISPNAGLRRGDRVVARSTDGEVMVKELVRQTANRLELRSLNPEHPDRTLEGPDLDWVARVLWVSQ